MNDNDFESFALADFNDKEILMHREAHFGGLFNVMIDYYKNEGKGVNPDLDLKRIESLAEIERQMQQNLAPLLLLGTDAEKVAQAKEAYKKLRDLYEIQNPTNKFPILIADLLLSEEENPEKEIDAIVAEKNDIVPYLIDLLRSEEIFDPLFPGYGLAPELIARCLEKIGDKRSLITLFESIGHGDFFEDEQILKALKAIGEPAKKFLLKVASSLPINEDNEKAAIALVKFKDDLDVGLHCLKLLKNSEFKKDIILSTYFVLATEGLLTTPYKQELIDMANDSTLPSSLRQDIKALINSQCEK